MAPCYNYPVPGVADEAPFSYYLLACLLVSAPVAAQGTIGDYQRAMSLRSRYDGLALNVVTSGSGSGIRTGSGIAARSKAATSSFSSTRMRKQNSPRSITCGWPRHCRQRRAASTRH